MADHVVEQGEHLARIARAHGFASHLTVWNDGANAALRNVRKNPFVLFPGDIVVIPDRKERKENAPTDQRTTFKATVSKLLLRIRLIDYEREAVPGKPCDMTVEGKKETLTTDGDGKIEKVIQPVDEIARLVVTRLDFSVKIGHLDPVEEESGVESRLNNLGYHVPPEDERDDDELRSSIEEFQCDFKMKVDGENNSGLQSRLRDEHGA